MPFEYKPLTNGYTSLDEIREFITRLLADAITSFNTANPNGLFHKTEVVPQGTFINLQDQILDVDSQIVVNVDYNLNRETTFNHKASNALTIISEISINLYNLENSRLRLDRMVEYVERAICFNDCYYTNQLQTGDGFSGKTYKSSLDKNKVQSISKQDGQTFLRANLQIIFKIEY